MNIRTFCIALLSIFSLCSGNLHAKKNHVFIDNGTIADQSVLPFNSIVRVTVDTIHGYFSCSGTLINFNTVLTAGHCSFDPVTNEKVRPSAYSVIRYIPPYETAYYNVINVASHYNSADMSADFSLLRIDNKNRNIPFSSLTTREMTRQNLLKAHPSLLTAGYGIDRNRNYQSPGFLQKGAVQPTQDNYARMTLGKAEKFFNQDITNPSQKISLPYDPNNHFATCSNTPVDHGDSGGPVFYKDAQGKYHIIGDTSWGVTFEEDNGLFEAYHGCVDTTGRLSTKKDISFFTDLTYGSRNYKLLQKLLKTL